MRAAAIATTALKPAFLILKPPFSLDVARFGARRQVSSDGLSICKYLILLGFFGIRGGAGFALDLSLGCWGAGRHCFSYLRLSPAAASGGTVSSFAQVSTKNHAENTPHNQKGGNAMRIRLVALALSFMILPALAQPTLRGTPLDKFKFMSRQDIAKQLTKPWPGEVYASAFMNDHEYFFVEFVKRLDHGNYIEQHTHYIDQTTIISGEGVLTYGGKIDDRKEIAPGEYRGHKQSGAKTQVVRPGDFVLIEPGMPHHFDAAPGTELVYVVYKHRV